MMEEIKLLNLLNQIMLNMMKLIYKMVLINKRKLIYILNLLLYLYKKKVLIHLNLCLKQTLLKMYCNKFGDQIKLKIMKI